MRFAFEQNMYINELWRKINRKKTRSSELQYGGRNDLTRPNYATTTSFFYVPYEHTACGLLPSVPFTRPKCFPCPPPLFVSAFSPIFLLLHLVDSIRSRPFSKYLNTLRRRSSCQITSRVFLLIYSSLYFSHNICQSLTIFQLFHSFESTCS